MKKIMFQQCNILTANDQPISLDSVNACIIYYVLSEVTPQD